MGVFRQLGWVERNRSLVAKRLIEVQGFFTYAGVAHETLGGVLYMGMPAIGS